MARKMVDVDLMIDAVNNVLAMPDDEVARFIPERAKQQGFNAVSYRQGIYTTLEHMLFMVDRYRGFNNLGSEFVDGKPELGHREGYDDSRRRYY